MRPLGALLDDDPAWPTVESWIGKARNDIVVLPTERERGEYALHRLQVTSHSTLGAVALETGGILVDHGWLRLFGAGSVEMQASFTSWNKIGDAPQIEPLQCALVVGYDAVGGFFAVNSGEFDGEQGHVFYFGPDTLQWGSLDRGYSEFVYWALTANLSDFYAELRWPGWQGELGSASPDLGFSLYPPPFVKDGRPLADVSRRLVPMCELWLIQQEYVRQLAEAPDGATVSFKIEE